MPDIGELDRRITIQRATITYNEFNEPVEAWVDYVTVWAKRTNASAGESYRAQQVGAQITTRFTVRWSPLTGGVTPQDRIDFDGRTYNITATRQVERNRWIEIDAIASAE